jgi:hypothetical protein
MPALLTACDQKDDTAACDFPTEYFRDADGDGMGNPDDVQEACSKPSGYVENGDDCNDADPTIYWLEAWYADDDRDGYGASDSSITTCTPPEGYLKTKGDCNDMDAAVHPGANEVCDGVDNNCNGYVDSADDTLDTTGLTPWYRDADHDGWGNPAEPVYGCTQPASTAVNSLDCDDSDNTVGAEKPWYQDRDGDGYGDTATEIVACYPPAENWVDRSNDCDETNPLVNPAADEICADWLDNDCDGTASCYEGEMPLEDAYAEIVGEFNNYLGSSVAGPGDVDGDGIGDFMVASLYTSPVLFYGPVAGEVSVTTADVTFTGTAYDVAGAGDQDGDGYPDMLFGNRAEGTAGRAAGAAYVYVGRPGATVNLATEAYVLWGEAAADEAGNDLAYAGDMNDDGWDDFLVGAWKGNFSAGMSGGVYLVLGPITSSMSLSGATARWSGDSPYDEAGSSVAPAGDTDGDGVADVVVGAPSFDGGGTGKVYVVSGAMASGNLGTVSSATLTGSSAGDQFGASVDGLGDFNGDGLDDIVVGAPEAGTYGRAYVFLGPIEGSLGVSSAAVTFTGEEDSRSNAGIQVAGPGDIDSSGLPDVLVAATKLPTVLVTTGKVYLNFAPLSGTIALVDSSAVFLAERANDEAGQALDGIGDVNNDGFADFMIGAPDANRNQGGAWLWYGGVP